MFPVVYDAAVDVAQGPAPGARALMDYCIHHYPPGTNLGIFNNRAIRGKKATSMHATGRAIDVGFPGSEGHAHPQGHVLAQWLVGHHQQLGVQCVIFARKIWSSQKPAWRAYTGTEGHWTHVHAELNRAAGRGLTVALINAAAGVAPSPPQSPQTGAPIMPMSPDGKWTLADAGVLHAAVESIYDTHRNGKFDPTEVRSWMRQEVIPALRAGQDPNKILNYLDGELAKGG